MGNVKQPGNGGPTGTPGRFPTKDEYETVTQLSEWYGEKYPSLRNYWENCRWVYEMGQSINVDM